MLFYLPVTGRHKDIKKQPGKQELLNLAMSVTQMSVDSQASVSIVLIKFLSLVILFCWVKSFWDLMER